MILVAAFFLRFAALPQMTRMLAYDEAWNLLDVISLGEQPRLTPFFPANNGREALWLYILSFFAAGLGPGILAMRVAPMFIGVLSVACMLPLTRAVFGRRPQAAGWLAMAVLATLYWHVHESQIPLRAILLPLFGALSLISLLHAHKGNRPGQWRAAGLLLGVLLYTYFSARAWIALIGVGLLLLFWRRPALRTGILQAAAIAVLIALPLAVYTALYPQEAMGRMLNVGVYDPQTIAGNAWAWLRALFGESEVSVHFNLPKRPIFDAMSGVLFVVGTLALLWQRPRTLGALVLLAAFAVLPAVLTGHSPHYLRGIGLVLPLALVAGFGGGALLQMVDHVAARASFVMRKGLHVLLAAGLGWSGVQSYQAFHYSWLLLPDVPKITEEHFNGAVDWIIANDRQNLPVNFSPYHMDHVMMQVRQRDLAPRAVGAFDSTRCELLSSTPAHYASISEYEPNRLERLRAIANVEVLHTAAKRNGDPLFAIYRASPQPELLQRRLTAFGPDALPALSAGLLRDLPAQAARGSVLDIALLLRAERKLDKPYSAFIHLYTLPTPYQSPSGRLVAQTDAQLCHIYPTTLWRPATADSFDLVAQSFKLPLPVDMPAGRYQIGLGLYESPEGERITPMDAGVPTRADRYVALHTIELR